MEKLQANTVGCLAPDTSKYHESDNGQIRVATTIDMEDGALDLRDDRNMHHLYNDAVRQVSRLYDPP